MKKLVNTFVKTPFVKHVATLQVGRFFSVLCSFLSSILYVRYLGVGGFGQYAVVMAFVGTMGIFTNLGQQATLTTFLAESYGKKDHKKILTICRYYASISLIASLLLITFAFLSPFITSWIYSDALIGGLAILVFASSLLEFPFSFVSITLQITRKIRMLTFIENAKVIVQLGLSVLLLILGYGVAGILIGSLLSAFIFLCVSLIIYPKLQREHNLPTWREMLQIRQDKRLWEYWKDGFWIALDKNIGNLYPTIFLFMLSIGAPKAVVGLMRLAFKLADLPTAFSLSSINRLSSSVLPEVAGRGVATLKNTVQKLVSYSVGIHSLLTIGALVCVPIFLPLIYGKDFAVAMYPFFVIVILNLLQSLHSFATPILRMRSKTYICSLYNLGAMLAAIITFIILNQIAPSATWALYGALVVYHITVSFVALPAWRNI